MITVLPTSINKIRLLPDSAPISDMYDEGMAFRLSFRLKPNSPDAWTKYGNLEFHATVSRPDGSQVSSRKFRTLKKGERPSYLRHSMELPAGFWKVQVTALGVDSTGAQVNVGEGSRNITIFNNSLLPPKPTSIDEHWLGVNVPQNTSSAPILDMATGLSLKLAGLTFVRVFYQWNIHQAQEDTPPDTSELQQAVETANFFGLKILPVITGCPAWAAEDVNALPVKAHTAEPDHDKFSRLLIDLATRFLGNIMSWEIINEANSKSWYEGSSTDYADLIKAAGAALHSVDPGIKVIPSGLTGAKPDYHARLASKDIDHMQDAINLHPYRFPLAIPEVAEPLASNGYGNVNLQESLNLVREAYIGSNTISAPMWLTELGYNTGPGTPGMLHEKVSEIVQAELTIRTLLLANASNISLALIWQWYDTYGKGFGALKNSDHGFEAKPLFAALSTLSRIGSGMHVLQQIDDGNIYVIRFRNGNRKWSAMWAVQPTAIHLQPLQGVTATAYSMYGEKLGVPGTRVSLDESPIYIEGIPDFVLGPLTGN